MHFGFAGRVRKGTEEEFLVSKGELIIPVRAGDVLDGTYRVVAAKADGIELVYLPLNTPERVAVSSESLRLAQAAGDRLTAMRSHLLLTSACCVRWIMTEAWRPFAVSLSTRFSTLPV